ncbi:hypothetical protein RU86_GL000569 [Lactococcus piscium]|uniref:Histidine phosphatase family protein n=1 Tax=Pseudolactococcus piscium TaxID=1364 RepID=A0A2A5RX87_9LACT|nr:histidine phosphatase family protein [Lactococcus piscium]PCS05814.1 hypothetical protein RU86_GL000569 [Lactococcus piscium]
MMQHLYLMRHGQTRLNAAGLNQGAWDAPLTPLGISQARLAGQWFKEQGISFDAAVSSTKERASDTLEIVAGLKDGDYARDRRLSEWDFGLFEGQNATLNPPPLQPDEGTISFGKAYVGYGGESDTAVSDRMDKAMTDIVSSSAQTSLVVSHGGSIYLWLQRHFEQEAVRRLLPFGNCAIFELTYEDGRFELVQMIDPTTESK